MIRVTVELVPYGDEERKEVIGTLVLANVATLGLGHRGYLCKYDAVYECTDVDNSITMVTDVRHSRQDGFWVLLKKILQKRPTKVTTSSIRGYTLERLIERL